MNPSNNQLDQLKIYHSASWALWSEQFDNPTCLEADRAQIFPYMKQNLQQLRTEIIFLGLNRSPGVIGGRFEPFHNFHSVPHRGDRTLKHYIQDHNLTNLVGGYMTDLNSMVVNATSNQVNVEQANFRTLTKQLNILGNRSFRLICFGNKTFRLLLRFFNLRESNATHLQHSILHIPFVHERKQLDIYRVWHYTDRGYNHIQVLQLAIQLAHLN